MTKLLEDRSFRFFVLGVIIAAHLRQQVYSTEVNSSPKNSAWVATEPVTEQCHETGSIFPYDWTSTCCQNKVYQNTLEMFSDDPEHEKCFSAMKEVDGDDIPTSLNRRYLCLLKTEGATAENLASVQNFFTFITQNYADSIKSDIMAEAKKCAGADKEKNEFKKFVKINDCLLEAETNACFKDFLKNKTKIKVSDVAQGFCKGKRTKLPTYDDLYFFKNITNIYENFHVCILPFKIRLQDFPSKYVKPQVLCKIPCYFRGDHFKSKSDLTIDIAQIKKDLFPGYSKKARTDLLKIWTILSSAKNFKLVNNSTGTIGDAVKWMKEADEPTYIKVYCGLFTLLAKTMPEMALEIYCRQDKPDKVLKIEAFPLQSFL